MKNKIFPIFIISLGLFTAYVFYALWHTEEVNPAPIVEKSKDKIIENLANKKVIPKENFLEQNTSRNTPPSPKLKEKVPSKTLEQMEKETQAVYDSLMPEEHEDIMEEVSVAFEMLDRDVVEIEMQLAEEEEYREEMMRIEADSKNVDNQFDEKMMLEEMEME